MFRDVLVAESDEDKPGVILDYDAAGDIVSIEVRTLRGAWKNPPVAIAAAGRFRPCRPTAPTRRSTEIDIALAAHAPMRGSYTAKQGQDLAFIYYYMKIHGRSPSEADMQGYFQVSPPTVHQMVMSLEKLGFIERTPGQGRSIKLLLPREQLPDLM